MLARNITQIVLTTSFALLGVASAQLTVWTTQVQPERVEVQEQIAADFEAESGISVEFIPIEESSLAERVTAAFGAGDLPDVIYHPVSQTIGWAEAGMLRVQKKIVLSPQHHTRHAQGNTDALVIPGVPDGLCCTELVELVPAAQERVGVERPDETVGQFRAEHDVTLLQELRPLGVDEHLEDSGCRVLTGIHHRPARTVPATTDELAAYPGERSFKISTLVKTIDLQL